MWKKKFKTDTEYVQGTGKSGQLVIVIGQCKKKCIKIQEKMKLIVDTPFMISPKLMALRHRSSIQL